MAARGASRPASGTRWAMPWCGRAELWWAWYPARDGAQVRLTEDQHVVEELAAQGADEAFAGRVHARSLDGGAQDSGAGGLEDGLKGLGEVRSAVADQPIFAPVIINEAITSV